MANALTASGVGVATGSFIKSDTQMQWGEKLRITLLLLDREKEVELEADSFYQKVLIKF